MEKFRKSFEKTGGELLVNEEPAKPLDEGDIQPEKIRQYVDQTKSQSTGIEANPGTRPGSGTESE
jgi:hypothetical protein